MCPSNAELHDIYCYKKCSVLTNGQYSFRLNAITCCRDSGKCSGEGMINPDFGELVSPLRSNGCMPDEEYSGGLCYKACTLLTNGDFPFRLDSHTCCRKSGYLDCRLPENKKRSVYFNVGGGGGCGGDAELLDRFCYKKCSILTEGRYPKRAGPSTCCTERDCDAPGNQLTMLKFNAGSDERCPENEELHASLCYKRCALLTNGTYPTRVAVATCCKEQDVTACGRHNTLWTDIRFGEGSSLSSQPVHLPASKPSSASAEG